MRFSAGSTAVFIRWSSTSVMNGCDIRIPEGVRIRIRLFGHYGLGCTRKYLTMLIGQSRLPITSLAYFASLIEEVSQPQIPASYWDHVRRRMEEMEKRWLQMANSV